MSHICKECHRPIPRGQAVIRSESVPLRGLERIYLHRDCHTLRGIEVATLRMTVEAHIRPLRGAL